MVNYHGLLTISTFYYSGHPDGKGTYDDNNRKDVILFSIDYDLIKHFLSSAYYLRFHSAISPLQVR